MSDWDASSGDEAPPKVAPVPLAAAGRRRFEDEDAEDEIKDDWESSDEEDKKATTPAVVAPAKKKMSFKQKIAQKEEEERKRLAAGLNPNGDDGDVDPMEFDPIARKRAERNAQIDADLGNASDLLGTTSISKDETTVSLTSAKPNSKAEWESLAADIAATLFKPQTSRDSTGYAKYFVPALTRQLIQPIRDVDARKLSTSVKTWADEKTKAEKEAKRSGGNRIVPPAASKPKQVGTASAKNTHDLGTYGNEALDDGGSDLDFM